MKGKNYMTKVYSLNINGPRAHSTDEGWEVIIPEEVYEDQSEFDGSVFPIMYRERFTTKWKDGNGKLRGDLYGLHTSGTGDPVVEFID